MLLVTLCSQARQTLIRLNDSYDVQLNQDQDNELQQLISAIQEKGQDQLEPFKDADTAGEGVGDELCQVWERDILAQKEFFED